MTPDAAAGLIQEHDRLMNDLIENGLPSDVAPEVYQANLDAVRDKATSAARELGGLGMGTTIMDDELRAVEDQTGLKFGRSARAREPKVEGAPITPRPHNRGM